MSWTIVEQVHLAQPSQNASGEKFYIAVLAYNAPLNYWGVVFNWGAGHGTIDLYDGQTQVEVETVESRARNKYRSKVTAKANRGYMAQRHMAQRPVTHPVAFTNQRVVNMLNAAATNKTAAQVPGVPGLQTQKNKEPKAQPGQTFPIDPVATLVSSPMTPALARRIVEERDGLVALVEKYQGMVDQAESKIEMLNMKLQQGVKELEGAKKKG